MKRCFVLFSVLVLALYLGAVPTFAQRGQGRGGGAPGGMGRGPSGAAADTSRPSPRTDTGKPSTKTSGKKTPDQLLTQNTKLADKLQGLLPKGTDVHSFCDGFKNLGQCVAAIHVAHNLGFTPDQLTQLRDKMLAGESLGKSIHDVNPTVNANAEAKKANKQASDDLKESSS